MNGFDHILGGLMHIVFVPYEFGKLIFPPSRANHDSSVFGFRSSIDVDYGLDRKIVELLLNGSSTCSCDISRPGVITSLWTDECLVCETSFHVYGTGVLGSDVLLSIPFFQAICSIGCKGTFLPPIWPADKHVHDNDIINDNDNEAEAQSHWKPKLGSNDRPHLKIIKGFW